MPRALGEAAPAGACGAAADGGGGACRGSSPGSPFREPALGRLAGRRVAVGPKHGPSDARLRALRFCPPEDLGNNARSPGNMNRAVPVHE